MAIQDYAPILNGVMWTQVVIAIVFIGARLYTRHYLINNIGWDDTIMVVNLVTLIGYVACISIGTTYGIGKKFAAVPTQDYPKAIMWEAIGQAICIMGIAASKGSVALFLLRIVIHKWHVVALWFCIVSTTIMCTVTTVLLFVQCKPTAFLWDQTIPGGVCWLNFTIVGLTMGAWSAAMDFVLAILPWHIIMGLNMKRKEKLTVAFGLSLGAFAGICSIVRTYELQALSSLNEYVYDTVPMLLWSSTEVLATIICACIPVLRPLYVKIKYGSRGESSSGRSYPLNSYGKNDQTGGTGGNGYSHDRSKNKSKVYMGPGGSLLEPTVKQGSEESILREQNRVPETALSAMTGLLILARDPSQKPTIPL
ncbi:hypothetical protein DM02DRAFT_694622 [Periconia macrospinosa]|uniref:Rhodopsin domain-containing protein n=1 Tax=Periconia macrospinosa TaxID=97972 RepID=A0A2V1D721_9PLEO|nr:hypothetical protein DM02DRAFT_694622 [Periconia macrospinosa]